MTEATTEATTESPVDALEDAPSGADDGELPVAEAGDGAEAKGESGSDGEAKGEAKDDGPRKPPEPAEFVALRRAKRAAEQRLAEAVRRESTIVERERAIADREKTVESLTSDPYQALVTLSKRTGRSIEDLVEDMNAKLAQYGQPESKIDAVQRELEELRREREALRRSQEEAAFGAERQRALQTFVTNLQDPAKHPELARMNPTHLADEVRNLAWGERRNAFVRQFGRNPTDTEIVEALVLRERARYRDETSAKSTSPGRATGSVESAKREQASGTGRRMPPATGNDLAASRPTTPGDMDPSKRRAWELDALEG